MEFGGVGARVPVLGAARKACREKVVIDLVFMWSPNGKDNRSPNFDHERSYRTYNLLDVLLCSIAEYFYELCRILAST